MAIPKEVADRRMLPQWLTPAQAAKTGERAYGQVARRLSSREEWWLKELKRRFEAENNFYTASDLHLAASIAGRPDLAGGATRVYERHQIGQRISAQLRAHNQTASIPLPSVFSVREKIAGLKRQLAAEGAQPLLWAELARNYVQIGQSEQALRCMRIALQMSGPHRYLYRTACRLFVHVNREDEAATLVRMHPGLQEDPWLLSCEIAVATVTGRTSKNIGRARKLLESGSVKPAHATELAAAIASVEHEAGAIKRAKKWYAMGAVQPTANTLAQIEWAHQKDPQIVSILGTQPVNADAGEAMAWRARHDRRWGDLVAFCQDWLRSEPYSSRPAILGSYYVELTGKAEFGLMEEIASAGLVANPRNPSLLNNRAVGRAYTAKLADALGDISMAIDYIDHLDNPEEEKSSVPFLRATLGLIAYRSGHSDLGEAYYAQSVEQLYAEKDRPAVFLAALHWAREEARLSRDVSKTLDLVRRKIKFLQPAQAAELQAMLDLVANEAKQQSLEIPADVSAPVGIAELQEADFRLQNMERTETASGATKTKLKRSPDYLIQRIE